MRQKAIFIDKDGTLIPDIRFNVNPLYVSLMPGAARALAQLSELGYIFVIVSNQPGIAYGNIRPSGLTAVQQKIEHLLKSHAIELSGFYYCPHAPNDGCQCRKPGPGLLKKAAEDLNIDLPKSWMIGDILDDIEAGHRAGCQSILLDNGHETVWKEGPKRKPDRICKHWNEISPYILRAVEIPDERLKKAIAGHQLVSNWS